MREWELKKRKKEKASRERKLVKNKIKEEIERKRN